MSSPEDIKKAIIIVTVINSLISVGDRSCQIIFFAMTTFINDSIRNTCIAFVIIKTLSHICMMIFYLATYNGKKVFDLNTKVKFFFIYVSSAEINYFIGAHKTFNYSK